MMEGRRVSGLCTLPHLDISPRYMRVPVCSIHCQDGLCTLRCDLSLLEPYVFPPGPAGGPLQHITTYHIYAHPIFLAIWFIDKLKVHPMYVDTYIDSAQKGKKKPALFPSPPTSAPRAGIVMISIVLPHPPGPIANRTGGLLD